MKPTVILVLAKCPEPGRVNTRLCPPLSPQLAADLHAACVAYTCQHLAASIPARRILVVSPDDSGGQFDALVGHDWEVWPQGTGDLGDRLARNIQRALSLGHRKVLCLGADSPTTPPERLVEGVQALDRCQVCLGPCQDGGIYLLGVSDLCPGLFEGIDWGGATVAEGLRVNAQRSGHRVLLLESGYDLDRPADLLQAAHDLAEGPHEPVRTRLMLVLREAESMI